MRMAGIYRIARVDVDVCDLDSSGQEEVIRVLLGYAYMPCRSHLGRFYHALESGGCMDIREYGAYYHGYQLIRML